MRAFYVNHYLDLTPAPRLFSPSVAPQTLPTSCGSRANSSVERAFWHKFSVMASPVASIRHRSSSDGEATVSRWRWHSATGALLPSEYFTQRPRPRLPSDGEAVVSRHTARRNASLSASTRPRRSSRPSHSAMRQSTVFTSPRLRRALSHKERAHRHKFSATTSPSPVGEGAGG
jgi:hypothetical protein